MIRKCVEEGPVKPLDEAVALRATHSSGPVLGFADYTAPIARDCWKIKIDSITDPSEDTFSVESL
jgi:hypothetical protein